MSKTTKIVVGLLIALVAAVGLFSTYKEKDSQNQATIKIGAVVSMSGAASATGESLKQGIDFAIADLKKDGLNVEVIYQDDKTEPKEVVSATNNLKLQNVDGIVGPTWGYLADTMAPVIDEAKIVTITPANSSEYVSGKSPYLFFGNIKNSTSQGVVGEYIKANNVKRIIFVGTQGSWSDTLLDSTKVAASKNGAEIVYSEIIPFGSATTSLETVFAKFNEYNPDLIISSIYEDPGTVKLFSKVQQVNPSLPVVAITESARKIFENKLVVIQPENNFYIAAPKISKDFRDRYYKEYGKYPSTYADRAYDSVMIIAKGMQKKGEKTLVEYIKSSTYKGEAGEYKFDANNDSNSGVWELQKQ